jgi:hypothetical protein
VTHDTTGVSGSVVAEVTLPVTMHSAATEILNSFHVSG